MSVNHENRGIAANSPKWGRFVAIMKALGEYTNDYLSGNKHKRSAYLKREKQK